jgi:hypothetical protein
MHWKYAVKSVWTIAPLVLAFILMCCEKYPHALAAALVAILLFFKEAEYGPID